MRVGMPWRTGASKISSASSAQPFERGAAPVSTTPEGIRSSSPALTSACRASERISSTRGSMISHRILRETWRGRRPPTEGTLITSSLERKRAAATPNFFLMRSASSKGVRRPTAMSFEMW